jgi:hypothetical protein
MSTTTTQDLVAAALRDGEAQQPAPKLGVTCAVCEELVERIGNGYVPNGSREEQVSLREAALKRLTATNPAPQQPAAVGEAAVDRVAAALFEEATDEPWTVAGVEHEGPDRGYYRKLARKVLALATQPGGSST